MAGKKRNTRKFRHFTDANELLAFMENFINVAEANRDDLPALTDEDFRVMRALRDDLRESIEASRLADAALEKANEDVATAQAAYDAEFQRHMTRQAQAGVSRALEIKKHGFQD